MIDEGWWMTANTANQADQANQANTANSTNAAKTANTANTFVITNTADTAKGANTANISNTGVLQDQVCKYLWYGRYGNTRHSQNSDKAIPIITNQSSMNHQ